MKTLITFYSRTGTTKKVAEELAKLLKADTEEILDVKSRAGALGYLRSGREAMKRVQPEIFKPKIDASQYDLVVIGTPVWGWNMASPVRSYISKQKFKNVAFFLTMGGSFGKTFEEMEAASGKKPKAVLALMTKEVAGKQHLDKVNGFVKAIKAK
jgi:flavodoxin